MLSTFGCSDTPVAAAAGHKWLTGRTDGRTDGGRESAVRDGNRQATHAARSFFARPSAALPRLPSSFQPKMCSHDNPHRASDTRSVWEYPHVCVRARKKKYFDVGGRKKFKRYTEKLARVESPQRFSENPSSETHSEGNGFLFAYLFSGCYPMKRKFFECIGSNV